MLRVEKNNPVNDIFVLINKPVILFLGWLELWWSVFGQQHICLLTFDCPSWTFLLTNKSRLTTTVAANPTWNSLRTLAMRQKVLKAKCSVKSPYHNHRWLSTYLFQLMVWPGHFANPWLHALNNRVECTTLLHWKWLFMTIAYRIIFPMSLWRKIVFPYSKRF